MYLAGEHGSRPAIGLSAASITRYVPHPRRQGEQRRPTRSWRRQLTQTHPSDTVTQRSNQARRTDLRSLSEEERAKYTIDTSGFQIVRHQSAEKDFVDEEAITTKYYKETEECVFDCVTDVFTPR